MFFVYFLRSLKNNKIYVGKTTKTPTDRLEEHNKGSNQWTKANGPFKLIYFEKFECSIDMNMKELFYKSGFGKKIRDAIIAVVEK